MHIEPQKVDSSSGTGPPIFHRAMDLVRGVAEVAPLFAGDKGQRARLKFRLSERGKFIHRNRYSRRSVICVLSGEQHWLLIDSDGTPADEMLEATQNDNWNGFRSQKHDAQLSVDEMHALAATARAAGIEAHVIKLQAGDMFYFNGRWWHATSYAAPVLSIFCVPGKDMECAVKEHKRRMGMKMQKDLKLATVNMAKCAKLSDSWKHNLGGEKVEWEKM